MYRAIALLFSTYCSSLTYNSLRRSLFIIECTLSLVGIIKSNYFIGNIPGPTGGRGLSGGRVVDEQAVVVAGGREAGRVRREGERERLARLLPLPETASARVVPKLHHSGRVWNE